ncbi:nucleotide sugar dehydrogenase [Candidatus Uhrbacteria bacterium]|nr:nucleotide sugar dehydrogenase [Candidatus Uhrbacteria bacterium]
MAQHILKEKIESRTAVVGIIGLGYVGLPLAQACLTASYRVIGIEKSEEKVASLKNNISYITDITSDEITQMNATGKFVATSDASLLAQADIILICVPTPIDERKVPDLSPVEAATRSIAPSLKTGSMVILESTVYPGCTEEFVQPILESSGLHAGTDFLLAFSPERVDPNNKSYPLSKIPKVVGGITPEATDLAAAFYATFTPTPFKVSSPRAAEMTKLLENMFRLVNISMINELSLLCGKMDIDIWEVIEAAKTKPYGYMPFYPGPGVGGHCIAVDPFYLTWKAKEYGFYPRFIELAGEINDLMPHYVVTKAIFALNKRQKSLSGSRVLVIGVAYKKDVGDLRDSAAIKIIADLEKKGAMVTYHDSYIPLLTVEKKSYQSCELNEQTVQQADLVLILTDHSSVDFTKLAQRATLIVDTRNAVRQNLPHIIT